MIVRADLHLHTRFSSSASSGADISSIVASARRKGLELIGSGDCLHPAVMEELDRLPFRKGLFSKDGISIVLQSEVEDINNAHHLIFFPSIAKVEEFREIVRKDSPDIDREGRPTVNLFGHELARKVHECGGLIGPAHLFTPYKGVLALYGSLEACYREQLPLLGYLELGLSADTDMANPMGELRDMIFLSNSDAHSTSMKRIGREFNLMELSELDYDSFARALSRITQGGEENNDRIMANYGLPPCKGRYNSSGCSSCHEIYMWEEAKRKRMRCHCGGFIKKGVGDIASENYDLPLDMLPERPPYHYILPLSEIIGEVYGISPDSGRTLGVYDDILGFAGDELSLFINENSRESIRKEFPDIVKALEKLLAGNLEMIPGGGGKYGSVKLVPEGKKAKLKKRGRVSGEPDEEKQKNLFEF